MLDSLGVEPVASWVLHHHERWDGHGYPDDSPGSDPARRADRAGRRRLRRDAERPCLPADLTHDRAVDELERCAGTQFDPDIVSAFKEEFDEPRVPELVVLETA